MARKPRILLNVQDHWRRDGLASFLKAEGFVRDDRVPEIILVDLPRSSEEIRTRISKLGARWPNAALLVLAPELRVKYILPCLSAGALGVISVADTPATLLAAIATVHAGDVWAPRGLMAKSIRRVADWIPQDPKLPGAVFSKAERRVLDALSDELSNKEIATLLNLSQSTIKFHISHMLRKTGMSTRDQLRPFAKLRPS